MRRPAAAGAWQWQRGRLPAGTLGLLAAGLLIADITAYAALQTFLSHRLDVTLGSLGDRIEQRAGQVGDTSISWDRVGAPARPARSESPWWATRAVAGGGDT